MMVSRELETKTTMALCILRDRLLGAMLYEDVTVDRILYLKAEISKIEKALNWVESGREDS